MAEIRGSYINAPRVAVARCWRARGRAAAHRRARRQHGIRVHPPAPRSAATWASANARTFSEIIRPASAAAFGAPDANSSRRAELTAFTSQAKRTASPRLVQNSFIATPGSARLDIPATRKPIGARSGEYRSNFAKLIFAIRQNCSECGKKAGRGIRQNQICVTEPRRVPRLSSRWAFCGAVASRFPRIAPPPADRP